MNNQPTMSEALTALAVDFDTRQEENLGGLSAICPHCGAFVSFGVLGITPTLGQILVALSNKPAAAMPSRDRNIHQLVCTNIDCRCVSIVASGYSSRDDNDKKAKYLELALLWPASVPPDNAPKSLEANAKQDYDEARVVLAHSPAAAATLVRRCMQHVIRTKMSIKDKNLFAEINAAVKSDILSQKTRKALDHVREIGNLGAHPDLDYANQLVRVNESDAIYTLFVLELLFEDLYSQYEQIETMTAALAEKKALKQAT